MDSVLGSRESPIFSNRLWTPSRAETVCFVLWQITTGHSRYELNARNQLFSPKIKRKQIPITKWNRSTKKPRSFWFTVMDMVFEVSRKPKETFQSSYLSEDWSILPEPRSLCLLTTSQNRFNQTNMFYLALIMTWKPFWMVPIETLGIVYT